MTTRGISKVDTIDSRKTRYGYEVETFIDPNLALQNFKRSNYDLLLLDVLMRGLNGFEKDRREYPDMLYISVKYFL